VIFDGKLNLNRSVEFVLSTGVPGMMVAVGGNDIGKLVLKEPALKKGDVTATGQLKKKDGTLRL
jgi:hypothetical protein